MSATATSLASALKEGWTSQKIAKQWFADDGPLSRFEAVEGHMIGKQAQTAIWGDLNSGGYTTTAAAGGAMNTATNQGSDQAAWTLIQQFMPISIEYSALNQSGSNAQAIISGKNQEIEGAIATLRNQATRQLVTNGDSKVATCGAATAAAIPLTAAASEGAAYGYSSIVRNWLRPGAVVDIGVVGDTDSVATAATVTAVAESATAPTITTSAGSVTVDTSTFVYIANPNSATAANPELNGLRNIANTSGALGGLNPATAGDEFWQAADRDTSTTVFSLDLALNQNRKVQQKSGNTITDVWSGLKQQMNFYSLLQNQVRFPGDMKLGAGNVSSVEWNNMRWTAYNAILDTDVFWLTLSDFFRVTGSIKEPTWMSSIQGANQGAIWSAGNTNFVDAVGMAFQIGVGRRNAAAAATALSA